LDRSGEGSRIIAVDKDNCPAALIKEAVMFNKQQLVMWAFVMALMFLWAGAAPAAEFSATMITKAGPHETQGKIFVKGNKVRNEMKADGRTQISIVRLDKKVMWLIMPAEKSYMEMPLNPQATEQTMLKKPEGQVEMKLLGKETVNGYETEKYETTARERGEAIKQYIWLSKKLGMPIKMAAADGSYSMEYRDIQEGGVSDTLFEPPRGYQKMQMPMGMPRRR
jgi:outer membrane lipoprotein-sorting protein